MKKLVIIAALALSACAKETLTEATVTARDGVDGKSSVCTVQAVEDGALLSCSDGTSVTIKNGLKGETGEVGATGESGAVGQPGTSCTITQTESGASISCGDSQANVYNGAQGEKGEDGEDGKDGKDGKSCSKSSSVTLLDYSGNSCTKIAGTSSYIKKHGNNFALYSNSNCSGNSKFAELSQGEAYWASATTLVTHAGYVARALTFN